MLSNAEREARMNEKMNAGELIESRDEMSDEYLGHLTNLMQQQADSELAGAFGYVPWIQKAPTVEEMLIVSNIVRDEVRHARAMYRLLEEIGVNVDQEIAKHDYTYRLENDSDLGAQRAADDKRVNIFYYTIDTWADFVMFNFLMDRGAGHQLEDVKECTFGPWRREIDRIFKEELTHIGHGEYWVRKYAKDGSDTKAEIQAALERWYPRTANIFGRPGTRKNKRYIELGLKVRDNQDVRQAWMQEVADRCNEYGLTAPEWNPDWSTVPEEARISG